MYYCHKCTRAEGSATYGYFCYIRKEPMVSPRQEPSRALLSFLLKSTCIIIVEYHRYHTLHSCVLLQTTDHIIFLSMPFSTLNRAHKCTLHGQVISPKHAILAYLQKDGNRPRLLPITDLQECHSVWLGGTGDNDGIFTCAQRRPVISKRRLV